MAFLQQNRRGLILGVMIFGALLAGFHLGAPYLFGAQADNKTPTITSSVRPLQTGPSGLPLPRFVSLKSDRINVRAGPGQDYPVAWIFTHAGMPVEIIAEFDNWRRIRDAEGAEGWVYHSLLSGRRTALVAPWKEKGESEPMFTNIGSEKIVANLTPNLVVSVKHCDGTWCDVAAQGYGGFIRQNLVWGVYPNEAVD